MQGNVITYYIYDGERSARERSDIDGQVREGSGRNERERMSQKPIVELFASGAPAGVNIYGKGIDEILVRADYVVDPAGEVYFYQQDHEGSVTHLTDIAGTVIESYRYDAFGAPTTISSSGNYNNRFLFTGREYAATFGFYEYRARAYNPTLGRFMSEDPKGFDAGDYNLFRYVGNDPLDLTDPMGLADQAVNAKMVQVGYVQPVMHVGSNIPVPTFVPVLVPAAALVEQKAELSRKQQILSGSRDGNWKVANNSNASAKAPRYELKVYELLRAYSGYIRHAAAFANVNARLIYGIAYVEESHGYYDAPLNAIGLNKSIRPMNINTAYWGNAFGTRAQLSNLQFNFNAGAELLSRITANVAADSSVAQIATLYNNINATEVSSYGMRVQAIYDNGP